MFLMLLWHFMLKFIFYLFLLLVFLFAGIHYKLSETDLCMLTLWLYLLIQFCLYISEYSTNILPSVNDARFVSSLLKFMCFILLCCLITLVLTYSTIINRNGDTEHSVLIPTLDGEQKIEYLTIKNNIRDKF